MYTPEVDQVVVPDAGISTERAFCDEDLLNRGSVPVAQYDFCPIPATSARGA